MVLFLEAEILYKVKPGDPAKFRIEEERVLQNRNTKQERKNIAGLSLGWSMNLWVQYL